jgi:hypothetical protein
MKVSLIYIINNTNNINAKLNDFKILLKKEKYEIILINNGINSNLNKYYENDPEHLKIINLSKSFSYSMALMSGINNCQGNLIISLNDMYNFNLKTINNYFNEINTNCDQIIIYNEIKKNLLNQGLTTIGCWIMQDNVKNALKYLYERKENINFKNIGFNTKAIIDENINIIEDKCKDDFYLIKSKLGFEESIL